MSQQTIQPRYKNITCKYFLEVPTFKKNMDMKKMYLVVVYVCFGYISFDNPLKNICNLK